MSEDKNDPKPDNKVVPFPMHKVKKPAVAGKPTLAQAIDRNKKATLFLSIFSTLVIATMLTNRLNQESFTRDVSDRMLASDTDGYERRDLDDDIRLAKKIARESLRNPASRGRAPTAEDILRHGDLAGLYALKFSDQGALTELRFQGQPGQERYVRERAAFLVRPHVKDLFRVNFNQSKLVESIQDNNRVFEVYELRHEGKSKARVHFEVDKFEHLYSMKVEFI